MKFACSFTRILLMRPGLDAFVSWGMVLSSSRDPFVSPPSVFTADNTVRFFLLIWSPIAIMRIVDRRWFFLHFFTLHNSVLSPMMVRFLCRECGKRRKRVFVYMKRSVLALLLIVYLAVPVLGKEATPESGRVLDLDECIEIALSSHPGLVAAQGALHAAEAALGQARTADNPSVSFSSSWSTQRAVTSSTTDDSFSSNVGVSQLVTDWGKTGAAVREQEHALDKAAWEAAQETNDVVYGVKESYFSLLKAEGSLEVAGETLALNDIQLRQATAFYNVGRVSRYDVTTAQVTQARARLALVQAQTARDEALVSLKTAMGTPEAPDFAIADLRKVGKLELTLEEALQTAFMRRPDLLAKKAQMESTRSALAVARLGNTPELSLTGDYSWGDTQFTGDDGWRTGLALDFFIYDGGLQKEKAKEAQANLQVAEANVEATRQDVAKEVQQAWLGFRDSIEAVAVAEEGFQMAEENLEIATGRYHVGVGSPIEVADATQQYSEAKNGYLGALYDQLIAKAALEQAMGGGAK